MVDVVKVYDVRMELVEQSADSPGGEGIPDCAERRLHLTSEARFFIVYVWQEMILEGGREVARVVH